MEGTRATSRRPIAAAVAVAFVVGSLGATLYHRWVVDPPSPLVTAPRDRSAAVAAFDPFILDPDDPTQPLMVEGEVVGLNDAQSKMPFPIYRPHASQASDETLTEVWINTDLNEVALRYASGIRVYLTVWPPNADPKASYSQQVAESGVGSVETIGGHPAYVVAADAQAAGLPPNSVVDLTIGEIEVSIHGPLPLDELIPIARSVR